MNLYLDLFYLTCIVTLINDSGFFESVDEYINKRLKFRHLPKIFFCTYCQTFWSAILYVLFYTLRGGIFDIKLILVCLLFAGLTEIISPLYRLVIEILKKIIELISRLL